MTSNNLSLLPLKNEKIYKEAILSLENERTGIQEGLISRWPVLNRSILKYFRFEDIITFAGMSGSGKSYITNMLRTDFTDTEDIILPINKKWSNKLLDHIDTYSEFYISGDKIVRPALNKDCNKEILFLDFCFDMSVKKEFIRTLVTMSGFSYNYILSSQATKLTDSTYTYNILTEEEMEFVKAIAISFLSRKNIVSFNTVGTIGQVEETIRTAYKRYPDKKIIAKVDHTLMLKKENESDDLDVQNAISRMAVRIKEEIGCMFIPICQTNNQMEDDKRRLTPQLHYPTKKDLYAGGQLYQASDYVFVSVMPSKLGIAEYGVDKRPTKDLIHLSMIKSRDDEEGQIWLLNRLHNGSICSASYDNRTKTFTANPNLNILSKNQLKMFHNSQINQ